MPPRSRIWEPADANGSADSSTSTTMLPDLDRRDFRHLQSSGQADRGHAHGPEILRVARTTTPILTPTPQEEPASLTKFLIRWKAVP
jgi:hypothetical protein